MPHGSRELEYKKVRKFLKSIGVNPNFMQTSKNECVVKYKGVPIYFSLSHGKRRLIREPYLNQILFRKLVIDGLNQDSPEFAIEFNNLKKIARKLIGF